MNKKQLINEIMDLCDENENLKRKIKSYEEANGRTIEEAEKETYIDKLNKKAKKLLFEHCTYRWSMPSVLIKEESNEFNFLTYEQWSKTLNIKSVFSGSDELLYNLSGKEIKEYFKDQLKEEYDEKLNDEKMKIVRSKKDDTETKNN